MWRHGTDKPHYGRPRRGHVISSASLVLACCTLCLDARPAVTLQPAQADMSCRTITRECQSAVPAPRLGWPAPVRLMTLAERVASWVSLLATVPALMVAPALACVLAGRRLAVGLGEHFSDLLVFQGVALWVLLLLPIKELVRDQVGRCAGGTWQRLCLLALGYLPVVGLLALVSAQAFFFATRRPVASTAAGWVADGIALLLAVSPQALALLPYIWAGRRVRARQQRKAGALGLLGPQAEGRVSTS